MYIVRNEAGALEYRSRFNLAVDALLAQDGHRRFDTPGNVRRGDIVLSVDGKNVVTATAIQQLMVEDAIARRIEMTVWRNGALVDVFVVPRELADR